METLTTGKLLLSEANMLWKQMEEEEETMNLSNYSKMVNAQNRDVEWQFIDKIDACRSDEEDMIKWVVLTLKLRLAWIKKWKARQLKT